MRALTMLLFLAAANRPDGMEVTVDSSLPAYHPGPPLTGDLHIVGFHEMEMIHLWVETFRKAHPAVRVHTALYASGIAPAALVEETSQVAPMGREFLPEEMALYRNMSFKPLAIPVAGGSYGTRGHTYGLVVFVHRDNPLTKLTLAQLDAIFSKDRRRGYKEQGTRWGQLGLTGEWADQPISAYGIERPNGIAQYFAFRALDGGPFKETYREQVTTDRLNALDAVVQRVAQDRFGIGYASHLNAQPGIKTVALAETATGPYQEPTFANMLNRTYPLTRFVYLYVNRYPTRPMNPLAKEFVRVALSREGQDAVARTVYMPLSAVVVRESLSKIE